jgi:hypothetical protein
MFVQSEHNRTAYIKKTFTGHSYHPVKQNKMQIVVPLGLLMRTFSNTEEEREENLVLVITKHAHSFQSLTLASFLLFLFETKRILLGMVLE